MPQKTQTQLSRAVLISLIAGAITAGGCASTATPTSEQKLAAGADQQKSTAATTGKIGSSNANARELSGKSTDAASAAAANQSGQKISSSSTNAADLKVRSVYFDFDKFDVKDKFTQSLKADADFLIKNTSRTIQVQGNADERGSREYNLALGQKRADAVRQSLLLLGASKDKIETISYGEERPKSAGHNEAAWAENRRADIKFDGEK